MKLFSIQAYYFVLLLNCIFVAQAKIVYINGTEIADDNLKNVNETTPEPVTKWFSVFNPKNISNHSGNSKRSDLHPLDSKNEEKQQAENDEKEQAEIILDDENYQSFNDTLATSKPCLFRETLLSNCSFALILCCFFNYSKILYYYIACMLN